MDRRRSEDSQEKAPPQNEPNTSEEACSQYPKISQKLDAIHREIKNTADQLTQLTTALSSRQPGAHEGEVESLDERIRKAKEIMRKRSRDRFLPFKIGEDNYPKPDIYKTNDQGKQELDLSKIPDSTLEKVKKTTPNFDQLAPAEQESVLLHMDDILSGVTDIERGLLLQAMERKAREATQLKKPAEILPEPTKPIEPKTRLGQLMMNILSQIAILDREGRDPMTGKKVYPYN